MKPKFEWMQRPTPLPPEGDPPKLSAADLAEVMAQGALIFSQGEPPERFEELIATLERTQFIFRFDWPQWIGEAQGLTQEPERIAIADRLTLRRLMTVYVRSHRFYNRYLHERHAQGQLQQIFARLTDLMDEP